MRINEWTQVAQQEGELRQYRDRTVALLRKYFRMSVELGHLPSLLGKEFFRSSVSAYSTHTFEDTAIFVHDMETAVKKLKPEAQLIIARVFFQEFTYNEAAALIGISRRHFVRRVADTLDSCSRILLDCGLLARTFETLSAYKVKALSSDEQLTERKASAGLQLRYRPHSPSCCQVGHDGRLKLIG